MTQPLIFYFDFSSPYGYLASTRIDALAAKHGRDVIWKPILLGVAFKTTGQTPLPMVPLKGDYSRHDFARSARYHGIAFRQPTVFPIASQAPSRAFYWLNERDAEAAKQLARELYRAYFLDDVNISNPSDTVAVAARMGLDPAQVEAALNDPVVKEKTKTEVEAAIAKGVFGSPYFLIDHEPFWGMDRFDQMERWLALGGF